MFLSLSCSLTTSTPDQLLPVSEGGTSAIKHYLCRQERLWDIKCCYSWSHHLADSNQMMKRTNVNVFQIGLCTNIPVCKMIIIWTHQTYEHSVTNSQRVKKLWIWSVDSLSSWVNSNGSWVFLNDLSQGPAQKSLFVNWTTLVAL